MRTLIATALLLAATPALAQSAKTVADGVYSDAQAARGKDVFMKECSVCHGTNLQGVNESPDLNSKMFISHWQGDRTLGDLYNFMSTAMPAGAPGSLSARTYADLLAFILQKNGFKSGAAELPSDQAPLDAIKFPK